MLKKNLIYVLITFLFFSNIFAQFSERNINRLNNNQLDTLKDALQSTQQSNESVLPESEDKIETEIDEISIESLELSEQQLDEKDSEYFGYNYFKKNINFFDNIPTPSDFKLGPGDEIILSLWGETNLRESFTINKDGAIYYSGIGFLNLSNKNIKEAQSFLVNELSRIYSTLKNQDNPTELMLELGQLKSINVYFSGHIENPGINLIHPFSDIFSAIVQAGGIDENGSLRAVQLIRNNQIIATVDFYSFFINGKNTFSNIKLIDGDTIHIPSFKNRITVSGEVNRPKTYELLDSETVSSIITYASGFTSNASSTIILDQIIPVEERLSDDNARNKIALNFKNLQSKALNNGDSVEVLSITNVDLNVEVFGRVKSPGSYPANNSSLKHVLDIAGGFDDPVFRQTILENEIKILRQDSNNFYATEFTTSYNEADKLQLLPNDKIFVYENVNYRNSFTYRIEGEVFKPGTYPFKEGLTLAEAIYLAGGLTDLSTLNNVVVFQEYTELDENNEQITKSESVGNVNSDFILGSNSVINALPFENVVRVEGNVYNPGLIAFNRGLTMFGAIEQAGGYKPYSIKSSVYVRRANGEVNKANIFLGRAKRVYPGDTVVVPVDPDPSEFDITTFIADLSAVLANIAAILFVVENANN